MSSKRNPLLRRLSGGALCLILAGCYSSPGPPGQVVELEAAVILPIESALPIEPSGLCLRDGELFSVSDDTDDWIFQVLLEDGVARFEPFLHFTKPAGSEDALLDLEGIVAGPEGSFYLLSEAFARVLEVFPDGQSAWATVALDEAGRELGLFKVPNGGLEGFTAIAPDRFLLLAERQPRGWLEVTSEDVLQGGVMRKTRFWADLTVTRIPDFTGADFFQGTLFVLFRNGELVTTLERSEAGWEEGPTAWSFRSVLADDAIGYRDTLYGMAEGLAVDDDFIYVVMDNNGSPRRYSSTDVRPLLLILKRR